MDESLLAASSAEEDSMLSMIIQNFNEILSVPFREEDGESSSPIAVRDGEEVVSAQNLSEASNANSPSGDQHDRYESVQRCIQSLAHACQCRDALCARLSCHKMKRVVLHTKLCKKRMNASCPVCKQVIALCCFHAKRCEQISCSVLFCMKIREKIKAANDQAAV